MPLVRGRGQLFDAPGDHADGLRGSVCLSRFLPLVLVATLTGLSPLRRSAVRLQSVEQRRSRIQCFWADIENPDSVVIRWDTPCPSWLIRLFRTPGLLIYFGRASSFST